MLITKDFVFIHVPKTGGTFITRCLRRLYTRSKIDLLLHRARTRYGVHIPFYPYTYRELHQHAMRRHIPAESTGLPIITCIRDPLASYVSHYNFGWWRRFPEKAFPGIDIQSHYPEFPELSFFRFVEAMNLYSGWMQRNGAYGLGPLSTEFLFYFTNPPREFLQEGAADVDFYIQAFLAENRCTIFIRQKRLNEDLYEAMLMLGASRKSASFILSEGSVNASRRRDSSQEICQATIEYIQTRERLLFRLNEHVERCWSAIPRHELVA